VNFYAHDLFSLEGKVAVVTGATRGIGLAAVRALASAGAHTVLTGLAGEHPLAVANELCTEGLSVTGKVLDVTDAPAQAALIAEITREHGRLDVLVCNAGMAIDPLGAPGSPQHGDEAALTALDSMFDVHVRSVIDLCASACPVMASGDGGSIIIMSSLAGVRGNSAIGLYGITKAANAQLARNLAVQWGPMNIRANAIAPGVIDTSFATPITGDAVLAEKRKDKTPLRRFGSVDNIAGTILYLAGPAGSFTSGETIVIDGGTFIKD
jgi:NAD(P)-dependent dehydrogenase (short-subunit alcohol dehydrogenase family)